MYNKDDLIGFCQDIIRIPSFAGKEKEVIQRAYQELLKLNFDHVEIDDFGSVVGILRNGDGPTVIFDAHMDTVGVEPRSEWSVDPFGAEVRDNKIYGRGAMDMKGPSSAMVYGLSALINSREAFRGTVIASLTTLEEISEAVALAHVIDQFGADIIVICEATNLRLARAQRGRAEIALTTNGVPSHSSTPQFGIDAVQKMTSLIEKMNALPMPTHPFLGSGVQALTDIISKPYPAISTIPYECRVTYDRRLLIGETEESILAELEEMIRAAQAEDPKLKATAEIVHAAYSAYTGKSYDFKKFLPAWEMPENHPVVLTASKALAEAQVGEGVIGRWHFCTNGSLPERHSRLPIIGFGPGEEGLAHRKDEYIGIDHLIEAACGYTALAKALSMEH